MKRVVLRSMLILTWLLQAVAHGQTPAVMEVFVMADQRDAITGVDAMKRSDVRVLVHVVNDLHLAEAELSALLPEGVEAAKAAAADLFRSMSADDEQRFVTAWFALQRAHRFNIQQTPAVVFDSTAVAYGVVQLESALSIWRGASQ